MLVILLVTLLVTLYLQRHVDVKPLEQRNELYTRCLAPLEHRKQVPLCRPCPRSRLRRPPLLLLLLLLPREGRPVVQVGAHALHLERKALEQRRLLPTQADVGTRPGAAECE